MLATPAVLVLMKEDQVREHEYTPVVSALTGSIESYLQARRGNVS
jgi:hypothetical protein